jgi:hypothetical protein
LILVALFISACGGGSGRSIIECGGGAKFACPKGMFCDTGENCGGFDSRGICNRIPQKCPEETSKDNEVCTCDERTYSSLCYAHASGRSVAYKGECIRKKTKSSSKKRKYEFVDTSEKIDASGVEGAGDVIHDQFSPSGKTR